MPSITTPFKTPLGQEELRTRAHKLGQRHRTILFLIDGRRPLSEVLSLAHQAGSATAHFEDLLRMGLVELPPDPAPPSFEIPTLTDELSLTSVDMVVVEAVVEQANAPVANPPEPPPEARDEISSTRGPAEPAEPAQAPIESSAALSLQEDPEGPFERTVRVGSYAAEIQPESAFERTSKLPEPQPAPEPAVKAVELPPVRERPARQQRRAMTQLGEEYGVTSTPASSAPAHEKPGAGADIALPLPSDEEAKLLQQVRNLLTDALRLDAPLFGARIFMRVRSAQSMGELINLVWEIEDHLSHKRRSRRELQSLQQAREMLGLGNTLVAGDDSRPDHLDK